MKYFKSDLWEKMQNDESQEILDEWNENSRYYEEYFNKISKHLPKNFIKVYTQAKQFHDYTIDAICIDASKKEQITLTLSKGEERYLVKLKNVEKYKINVESKEYCICGNMSWGYAEFEWLGKSKLMLSILCDIVNEFEFVFNKISVGLIK